MFIVLPLGRLWRMLTGVPYVIDLQDPWITDYYERPGSPRPPGGWKYRVAQIMGRALEGWTMRRVAGLIAVSAAYIDTLRARYPGLRATPAIELPFGSPDPDLAHLRATLAGRPHLLPAGGLRLAFAGALGPGQLAAVAVLFAALAEVRRAGLPVTMHFFGTSYAEKGPPATLALATQYGLLDCVHEQPGRLRYFAALQVTLEADANLLFGSTDLAFTPSKLVALLGTGRPVLALAPAGSAMIERLSQLGQSCVVFSPAGPDQASVAATVNQLRELAAGRAAPIGLGASERYSARAVAARQLEILNAASAA